MVPRLRLACLLALLAAGVAARLPLLRASLSRPPARGDEAEYADLGHRLSLLNGAYALGDLPGREAHRAGLYPGFLALLDALSLPARAVQLALGALAPLLAFWLAARLVSDWAGLLAGALLAVGTLREPEAALNVHFFFGLLVLVAAAHVALWAREPGESGAILAGLSVGLALCCRSALLAFVPALALAAWLARRRRQALLFCAACAATLLPWTLRNAVVLGEFVPLERHAARLNLFMASLGEVDPAGDQDARARAEELMPQLRGQDNDAYEAAMAGLARENIAARPLVFLGSALRREARLLRSLAADFALSWLVLGAAVLALILHRGRREFQALGLLCACFLGSHALVWGNDLYTQALVPIICVLAGCVVAHGPAPDLPAWPLRAASAAGAAIFAAAVLLLSVDAYAARHPERFASKGGARCVGLGDRAARLYVRGDAAGALAAYDRAIAAEPGCPELFESRAVARGTR